jgi:hypothetical protein
MKASTEQRLLAYRFCPRIDEDSLAVKPGKTPCTQLRLDPLFEGARTGTALVGNISPTAISASLLSILADLVNNITDF